MMIFLLSYSEGLSLLLYYKYTYRLERKASVVYSFACLFFQRAVRRKCKLYVAVCCGEEELGKVCVYEEKSE